MKIHLCNVKFALLLAALIWVVPVRAAEINVAAASNVQFAFDDLVTEFHKRQPDISVKVTYGSSGNFYAQLQNQAPFDLFFSADMEYPTKLADAGIALDNDVFFYAAGRIVVWALNSSQLDLDKLGIQALLAPSVKKIAIANPLHAPYGVAAVAALKSLQVYEAVEPKLVYGDNISQTAQFVQTGSADVGIIALSMAMAPELNKAGRYWQVPAESYPPVEQGGIILNWSKEPQAARAFRDFVLGEHGREVLARYGYVLPEK